jgi:hypothetical protein
MVLDFLKEEYCGYAFISGVKLVRLKEKKVEPKSTHCFVGN